MGAASAYRKLRSVITLGMFSFGMAEMTCDDRDYDTWAATLAQASDRLDVLETAVAEIRRLCQSGETCSAQILEVLEKLGAISTTARGRFVAA